MTSQWPQVWGQPVLSGHWSMAYNRLRPQFLRVLAAGTVSRGTGRVTMRLYTSMSCRWWKRLSITIPCYVVWNLLWTISQPVFGNTGPRPIFWSVRSMRRLVWMFPMRLMNSAVCLRPLTFVTTRMSFSLWFLCMMWLGLWAHSHFGWSMWTLRCRRLFRLCWSGSSYNLMHFIR